MKTRHVVTVSILAALIAAYGLHYATPKQAQFETQDKPLVKPLPPLSPRVGPSSIYPNLNLTPGVTNPDVTQANVSQNICNPHWSTKSIRPPVSYTNNLKKTQIDQYGFSDKNLSDYEEDHLISLELGGSPTDPKNLWPEAYLPKPGAREKDKVENYLHAQVCANKLSLQDAQKEITTDWYKLLLDNHL